jgi:glycosyltransferase involved in cell wall biosynthesis|tara:strand:+ start:387 stop:1343 length:957 start_codon:yes stop_codon:yes gene_type:complete
MSNYNNGQYIKEAIESVIHQTFSNWELLIIDDGSTDDSIARIQEYLSDDRITLIKKSVNEGKVSSLVELISKSQADIFGVLDSDDALTKNALSVMYEHHIKRGDCGFIHSQFMFCDENLYPICEGFCRSMPRGETNLRSIYSSAFRTFKKDYYMMTEGYNEKFIFGQDRDIVFKMEEVTNLLFVNKILYKHRILSDSISNDPNNKPLGHLLLIQARYDAFCRRKGNQIPNLTNKEMSVELCFASFLCLRLREGRKMIQCFNQAIALNPILFFSMVTILLKKFLRRIKILLRTRTFANQTIYAKVDKEIRRQLGSALPS